MNKERRKLITKAAGLMGDALGLLEEARDDEQDAMNNLEGTNLENSERYSQMEENVDTLEEACSNLQDVIDSIEDM